MCGSSASPIDSADWAIVAMPSGASSRSNSRSLPALPDAMTSLSIISRARPSAQRRAGDCRAAHARAARAAVGLQHVAVDADRALAERRQVDDGAQAAADQPLDLLRAARLLALGGLAPRACVRRARQHPVFGGEPAPALATQESGHA